VCECVCLNRAHRSLCVVCERKRENSIDSLGGLVACPPSWLSLFSRLSRRERLVGMQASPFRSSMLKAGVLHVCGIMQAGRLGEVPHFSLSLLHSFFCPVFLFCPLTLGFGLPEGLFFLSLTFPHLFCSLIHSVN